MSNKSGENYLPWYQIGKPLVVRSAEEIKFIILN